MKSRLYLVRAMARRGALLALAASALMPLTAQGANLATQVPPGALAFLEMPDASAITALEGLGAAAPVDAGPLLRAASMLKGMVGANSTPFTGHCATVLRGVKPASPPVPGIELPGLRRVVQCDLVLLLEHRGDPAQAIQAADAFMAAFLPGGERREGVALGHTIHSRAEITREPVSMGGKSAGQNPSGAPLVAERKFSSHWMANGRALALFIGEQPPTQQEVRLFMEGGAESLANTDAFRRAMSALGEGSHLRGYVDTAGLTRRIAPLYEGYRGRRPSALRLEEFRSAGIGARLAPGELEVQLVLWAPEPRRGLASILFHSGPLTNRALPAVPNNSPAWAAFSMDWRVVWLLGNQLLAAFSPRDKLLLDQRVALVESILALSIEDELLGELGPEAAFVALPRNSTPTSAEGMAVAWQILDAPDFDTMIGRAFQIGGALTGSQAQVDEPPGMRIWSLVPVEEGMVEALPLAVAITKSLAVFSDSAPTVLRVVQSGAGGSDPLRKSGPLGPLLGRLPMAPFAAGTLTEPGRAPSAFLAGRSADAIHVAARIPLRAPSRR